MILPPEHNRDFRSFGSMTEQEKTLLAGCLEGEKAAWDTFVRQYSGLVFHTIKRTLVLYHSDYSNDLIQDLYQETFAALLKDHFKKLRQFRGDHGCSLASWIRLIATRLAVEFLRKQKSGVDGAADAIRGHNSDPSDFPIGGGDHEKLLTNAIAALSPRDRILVDLCYRQGLPTEKIAAILRTSANAVYTQKSRILDKLREAFRKTEPL